MRVPNRVYARRHLRVDSRHFYAWKNNKAVPDGVILYYNADYSARRELTRYGHKLEALILGDQHEIQPDGSVVNIGANPPVDGEKWLRSCGAVTNLFSGDTSVARSVTLTAQKYTLHVFGAGSASCSYGTATVGNPLTFTATAGTVTFTPTGATLWMLTATAYPVPYTPPGTTMPASNATITNGSWFKLADGSPVWKALTGQTPGMTLATRVMMGVGSGDLTLADRDISILSPLVSSMVRVLGCATKASGDHLVVVTTDGSGHYPMSKGSWVRNSIILRFVQVNTAGTQFRVGYMIEGTHTAIQWSSWVTFDGSFEPGTIYRLMLGYNNPYPMWFNKIAVWKKQASDAEILEALS